MNAIGDSSSTAGFGLAFSPGRSGFKPAAVSLREYADPSRPLTRLWGSTTFSYAQNTKTLAGTDYSQRAVAVNVSYYLDAKEDPMVAGFRAVGGYTDSPCAKLAEAEIVQMQAITSRLTARLAERQRANGGRPVSDAEQTQIENDDRELDLDTIAATPGFKRSSLAAARYTYGYGEGRKTYALAEVSNAKSGSVTLSNAAFKAAVGIDHKIADGMWIEFRAGRSRTANGTSTENKALFNLKFSPESTLTRDAGG